MRRLGHWTGVTRSSCSCSAVLFRKTLFRFFLPRGIYCMYIDYTAPGIPYHAWLSALNHGTVLSIPTTGTYTTVYTCSWFVLYYTVYGIAVGDGWDIEPGTSAFVFGILIVIVLYSRNSRNPTSRPCVCWTLGPLRLGATTSCSDVHCRVQNPRLTRTRSFFVFTSGAS